MSSDKEERFGSGEPVSRVPWRTALGRPCRILFPAGKASGPGSVGAREGRGVGPGPRKGTPHSAPARAPKEACPARERAVPLAPSPSGGVLPPGNPAVQDLSGTRGFPSLAHARFGFTEKKSTNCQCLFSLVLRRSRVQSRIRPHFDWYHNPVGKKGQLSGSQQPYEMAHYFLRTLKPPMKT